MNNLYVADWDRGTQWAFYNGVSLTHVTKDNFAEFIRLLPANSILVVESAHLQPRTPLSVAQVYEQSDLAKLDQAAVDAGISIFAFPEILSFRARSETKTAKADDTSALYTFIVKHPEISLMRWHAATENDKLRWDYLNSIRDDCTVRLNILRPDYKSDEVEKVRQFLEDHFDSLSQEAKNVFKISKKRKLLFNRSRVMSVYVTCFDGEGNLRLNPEGKFIGIRTVWAVLKLHPYHRKAGTARSNLMYHTLRNMEGKVPGNKAVRSEFRKAIKDLIRLFRDEG